MRIGIDARWIFEKISGIGSYTQELIAHLPEVDQQNHYVLLFGSRTVMERTSNLARLEERRNVETVLFEYSPFSWRSQTLLPRRLRKLNLDVYHAPNYMIPFPAFAKDASRKTACVMTIHDLIPLIFPDHAPKSKKSRLFPLFKKIMLAAAARADLIIAPSECSRNDIIARLQIPETKRSRVVVIPEGVDARYKPLPQPSPSKVVLYVGRQDPYKNLASLVRAFAKVHEAVPSAVLRVIGPPDKRYPEAFELARELNILPHIDWHGYVDNAGLLAAYQQAAVLVLPSRYEGFGLPVVEAMACGTPVVCSNVSSLPEVAGDAALMADPGDASAFAEHIVNVLTRPELARGLREKGVARAAQFTWQKTAEQTLKAYEEAKRNI